MKLLFSLLFIFTVARHLAQVDTFVWDAAKLHLVDQEYKDGYHIFKKNGVIIKEYSRLNGQAEGLCKNYYNNGSLQLVYELRHKQGIAYYNGPYKEYYENGQWKQEGNYGYADSIQCLACFDPDWNLVITKASTHSARLGPWQEFFENGQLKSSGCYKNIHVTFSIHYPKPTKSEKHIFIPGDYFEDYLKDGPWTYYDEQNCLVKEEFYVNGWLADVKTYEY